MVGSCRWVADRDPVEAGTEPGDVTRLIKQFGDMQKMMKRMGMGGGKKGKRGMPGMGGLGGKNMPDMAELEQMMGGGGQFPR